MTTLGIVGAGNIGSTVAKLAVDAGHDVVIANSRGPETLTDLVASFGDHARAATAAEAAQAGDLVVVTVPLKALDDLPADATAGKVVMDTINYYPERDGQVPSLDEETTTTSELVLARLVDAQVVKTFNNIYFQHLASLARPTGDPDRATLVIAGDDAEAKVQVTGFLDSIGYDAYDAGPLAEGWRFQRDTAAYAGMYATDGDWEHPTPATRTKSVTCCPRRSATATCNAQVLTPTSSRISPVMNSTRPAATALPRISGYAGDDSSSA